MLREMHNHAKKQGRKSRPRNMASTRINEGKEIMLSRLLLPDSERASDIMREVSCYWELRRRRVCLEDKL